MPTSARYAGRNARLFIGPTNGAVAVPMVFISNFTLDSSTDQFDVTAFGDGNKHKVTGLPNGDGTFKGFADIAGSDTYTASRDGLDRKSYFYPDFVNDPGSYYFFTAYYDYSGAWDVNAGASVSGKWSASSDIVQSRRLMPWAFTVFDEKFREQELTLGQAEQIEELMSYVDAKGVAVRPNWYEINPARSATAASAIAAVMYANRAGIDPKEALSKVHELTVPEFVDDVDLNDVDDLPTVVMNGFPPEAGEPSTDD